MVDVHEFQNSGRRKEGNEECWKQGRSMLCSQRKAGRPASEHRKITRSILFLQPGGRARPGAEGSYLCKILQHGFIPSMETELQRLPLRDLAAPCRKVEGLPGEKAVSLNGCQGIRQRSPGAGRSSALYPAAW